MRSGVCPVFFHSPVRIPCTLAVITISDMNIGHASVVPHDPNMSFATPYINVLPNQKIAITKPSTQYPPVDGKENLCPVLFLFSRNKQYRRFGIPPATISGSHVTIGAQIGLP